MTAEADFGLRPSSSNSARLGLSSWPTDHRRRLALLNLDNDPVTFFEAQECAWSNLPKKRVRTTSLVAVFAQYQFALKERHRALIPIFEPQRHAALHRITPIRGSD
jgi:hypothetical protein